MPTILEVIGLGAPLRAYQFRMQVQPLRGLTGVSEAILSLKCTATALPGRAVEPTIRNLAGHQVRYAGRGVVSGNWQTQLSEFTDSAILKRLSSWQSQIFNQISGIGAFPVEYKSTAIVELLDDKQVTQLSRRLIGVWPSNVDDMAMNMASSEAVDVGVVWTYDTWVDQ
jgi:hypothetical protein